MLGMLTRMQTLKRKAQAWKTAPRSPTKGKKPPTLTEYWQARYPKYDLAPHIKLMIEALENLGPDEGLIITMPPRHSKCQPVGSPVLMADGTIKTIEQVKPGDIVISVTERYTLSMAKVTDVCDNGTKEVVRVHLNSGRFIDCTLNHPLLTVHGYREAETLAQGNFIGVVRQTPEGRGERLPTGYPAILGYLAGDGSTSKGQAIVTSTDPEVIADLYRLAKENGWMIYHDKPISYHFRRQDGRGPIASAPGPMLRPFGKGIFGCKAGEKRVPQTIFAAPNEQVAEFLAAYFDCDGHVAHCRGGYAEMSSASEGLARDVQQLCTRLGIFADLRSHTLTYKGELRSYWKVIVRGSELERFAAAVPLKGSRRHKLLQVIQDNATKRRFPVQESIPADWVDHLKHQKVWFRKVHGLRFDKQYKEGTARHIVQRAAELDDNDHLRKLCSPDVLWERITKIESLGAVQTHGLSVERDHVYVSGGVISHNTETVKAWMEWMLGQHPEAEAMYASYSVRLARTSSRSIRNEIATGLAFPKFFPNVSLSEDAQGATDWGTNHKGFFRAAGVGGSITGMGAFLAVIDDPIKGRKEAESETVRENVWNWFTADLLTRLAPGARVVLMHTRWHPDDLAGRVLAKLAEGEDSELGGLTWIHLNLPAIYDDPATPDPLGRVLNEPLWAKRFGLKKLLGMKAANEYDFEALYQQRPRKRGGQVFSDTPARYVPAQLGGTRLVITCDTASSRRKTADFTAFTVLAGRGYRNHLTADVLEVQHARLGLAQLTETAKELQGRYGAVIVMEETAQSMPIIEHLQMNGVLVRGVKPVGDKYTRAQPVATAWNAGRIRVPQGMTPWLANFLSELASFTGTDSDPHDDQVDALAYAWLVLLADPEPVSDDDNEGSIVTENAA